MKTDDTLTPDEGLAMLVGIAAEAALVAENATKRSRRAIRQALEAGASISLVSRATGLDRGTVRRAGRAGA